MKKSCYVSFSFVAAFYLIMQPQQVIANGNTIYSFNFVGNNGSASGNFTVQPNGLIVSVTGTVYNFPSGSLSITSILPVNTYGVNDNLYFPAGPYLSAFGVAFYTGSDPTQNQINLRYTPAPNYSMYATNDETTLMSLGPLTSSGPLSQ